MDSSDIPNTNGRRVAATETSFQIIEELKHSKRAGVTELANKLNLSKGTVHKHLNTLRSIDYVVKNEGEYQLSVRFLDLGFTARLQSKLYEVSQRPLEMLAETTGKIASVMIAEHGYGVYVSRVLGTGTLEPPVHEGERVPLHATAGGKAILANRPRDEVDRILDGKGLPAITENTITDRGRFIGELQAIHDGQMAHDCQEHSNGWYSIACPITDEQQYSVGAITVTGTSEYARNKFSGSDIFSIIGSTRDSIQNRIRNL